MSNYKRRRLAGNNDYHGWDRNSDAAPPRVHHHEYKDRNRTKHRRPIAWVPPPPATEKKHDTKSNTSVKPTRKKPPSSTLNKKDVQRAPRKSESHHDVDNIVVTPDLMLDEVEQGPQPQFGKGPSEKEDGLPKFTIQESRAVEATEPTVASTLTASSLAPSLSSPPIIVEIPLFKRPEIPPPAPTNVKKTNGITIRIKKTTALSLEENRTQQNEVPVKQKKTKNVRTEGAETSVIDLQRQGAASEGPRPTLHVQETDHDQKQTIEGAKETVVTREKTKTKSSESEELGQKIQQVSDTQAHDCPLVSDWVMQGMIPRCSSDSETDEEELAVWAHRKLGAPIRNLPEVERKRRKKWKKVRRYIIAERKADKMKRKKEQAKPLTQAEVAAILAEDTDPHASSTWVRRSMRQPSRSALNAPGVKELIAKLSQNDPDMVVLKLKKYCSDCDTPQIVMDRVLDALEENTNCEALYIQNFNEGMRDDQVIHLLRILKNPRCKVWCLNIGETYKVKSETWEKFARGLSKTKITHMYASEHTITSELKDQIRETIRLNRRKHNMHNDPENLDTIIRCTHCWWNPINAGSLKPYIRKYEHILQDVEAQGLQGSMTGASLM